MSIPPLILCRLHSRLDFRPKSILYYDRRAPFASRYFPRLYADWEMRPNELRLTDHATEKRMVLMSGSIGFDIDGNLQNPKAIVSHMAACMRTYIDEIVGDSKLTRLGLAMSFLTENSSFEQLFPAFKANTIRGATWPGVTGYDIRDIGFKNIYYGRESNGLNLQIGVLTADQAKAFRDNLEFKRKRAFADIEAGGLLIGLDRYITEIKDYKRIKDFLGEYERIIGIANELATSALQEDQP